MLAILPSFSVSILFFTKARGNDNRSRAAEKLIVLLSYNDVRQARNWYYCRYQILTKLNFHLTEYRCKRFTTPFNVNVWKFCKLLDPSGSADFIPMRDTWHNIDTIKKKDDFPPQLSKYKSLKKKSFHIKKACWVNTITIHDNLLCKILCNSN